MSKLSIRRTVSTLLIVGTAAVSLVACGSTSNTVLTSEQQKYVMAQADTSSRDNKTAAPYDSRVEALKAGGYTVISLVVNKDSTGSLITRKFLFAKCELTVETFQQCANRQPTIDAPNVYTQALSTTDSTSLYSGDVLSYVAVVKGKKGKSVTLSCVPEKTFQLNADSIKKLPLVFHAFTKNGVQTGDMLVDFGDKTPKGTFVQEKVRWTCTTKK